jgi:hemoglobin-like flavoprotein
MYTNHPEYAELLEHSIAMLGDRTRFAHDLYNELFYRYPEMKSFFVHTDMASQYRKLDYALTLITQSVRYPLSMEHEINQLGEIHHIKFSLHEDHYAMWGDAFMVALERQLGSAWTPELREAWEYAYKMMIRMMMQRELS